MGRNFDDYLGFQQIPGMPIRSIAQNKIKAGIFFEKKKLVKRAQEITYRFFFLRSKSPLGPAVDEGGGIPGCDIPMLMLSPEDVGIILENKLCTFKSKVSKVHMLFIESLKIIFRQTKMIFLYGTIDKFHEFKVEPGAISIHKLKQFPKSIFIYR